MKYEEYEIQCYAESATNWFSIFKHTNSELAREEVSPGGS